MDMSLSSVVLQIVMMAVTTVLGWALGALREKAKNARETRKDEDKDRETAREADRLLLYYRLSELYDRFVVKGEPITLSEKEKVQELYECYKARGGNGAGTQMYSEILELKMQV